MTTTIEKEVEEIELFIPQKAKKLGEHILAYVKEYTETRSLGKKDTVKDAIWCPLTTSWRSLNNCNSCPYLCDKRKGLPVGKRPCGTLIFSPLTKAEYEAYYPFEYVERLLKAGKAVVILEEDFVPLPWLKKKEEAKE